MSLVLLGISRFVGTLLPIGEAYILAVSFLAMIVWSFLDKETGFTEWTDRGIFNKRLGINSPPQTLLEATAFFIMLTSIDIFFGDQHFKARHFVGTAVVAIVAGALNFRDKPSSEPQKLAG